MLFAPTKPTLMANTTRLSQTLLVPAVVSLLIFVFLTYAIVPVWRRYRNRYSQYLPLDTISNQTSSLRHRIGGRLARFALPSAWRREREVILASGASSDNELDEGEELNEVDAEMWRRIERHGQAGRPDNTRRLSRE